MSQTDMLHWFRNLPKDEQEQFVVYLRGWDPWRIVYLLSAIIHIISLLPLLILYLIEAVFDAASDIATQFREGYEEGVVGSFSQLRTHISYKRVEHLRNKYMGGAK